MRPILKDFNSFGNEAPSCEIYEKLLILVL